MPRSKGDRKCLESHFSSEHPGYMYMGDHGVPHCHAVYGDYAGSFSLDDGERLAGQMPPAQAKKIKAFILENHAELREKWDELTG
jgi:hypothetical protein